MDTNLKQGKKIRAFIYSAITFSALFTMLLTILIGREAFVNFQKMGTATLSGDIYYLTEFREYISQLYTNAAIAVTGITDDQGNQIAGSYADTVSANAKLEFKQLAEVSNPDLTYYACRIYKWGSTVTLLNASYPLFTEADNQLILSNKVRLCCYWNGMEGTLSFFEETSDNISELSSAYYKAHFNPNAFNAPDTIIMIAVSDTGTYESPYLTELSQTAHGYRKILWTAALSCALFLLFAPACLFTHKAGKASKTAFAEITQKIPFEIKCIILVSLGVICYRLHLFHFDGSLHWRMVASTHLYLYFILGVLIYLSVVSLLKKPSAIWRNSLLHAFCNYAETFFIGIRWKRKMMFVHLITTMSSLLLIFAGLLLILPHNGLMIYVINRRLHYPKYLGIFLLTAGFLMLICSIYLKKFIYDTVKLIEKMAKIQAGNPGLPLELGKKSPLQESAANLNSIAEGIKTSVAESTRSNQMRIDLITNVSHDLKTPLTSIINYADLLCEELLPPPASEYAQALRDKSYRLKNMVQDVFEVSKATSGNLPLELVELDLRKLIEQTLADMDERIQKSSLTLKTHITAEPLLIQADGEKLYRVFQNLIVNALQYSLENSRIHVYVDKDNKSAYVKIKNTSKQELNFDTEKIVDRFVRADTSRTTEGSGLGLSIAQSFTEACGGTFQIETDADMFTALVSFPLVSAADNA